MQELVLLIRPGQQPVFGPADAAWLEEQVPGIRLRMCTHEDEALQWAQTATALASYGPFPERFFRAAPRLRWVHTLSAGVNSMLHPLLRQSDVVLTCSRGAHAIAIAEHVFALVLALARQLPQCIRQQQEARWQRIYGDDIFGKTMGIVGFGSIGREVARRGRAMGMKVIGLRTRPEADQDADRVVGPAGLPELLAESDVVVLCLPLTPATRGLIGREQFSAMKPDALFINVGRGEVVNEGALTEHLAAGKLKGTGLDALSMEPLSPESPLWRMERVIITPHSAGLSPATRERVRQVLLDNLTRFVHGTPLVNQVDKESGY